MRRVERTFCLLGWKEGPSFDSLGPPDSQTFTRSYSTPNQVFVVIHRVSFELATCLLPMRQICWQITSSIQPITIDVKKLVLHINGPHLFARRHLTSNQHEFLNHLPRALHARIPRHRSPNSGPKCQSLSHPRRLPKPLPRLPQTAPRRLGPLPSRHANAPREQNCHSLHLRLGLHSAYDERR